MDHQSQVKQAEKQIYWFQLPLFYWTIYIALVTFRISSAIHLHPGYLHPDEYFQSIEPITGDIYSPLCIFRTWDFRYKGHGPIRSISALAPFVYLPILIASQFSGCLHSNRTIRSGEDWLLCTLLPVRLLSVAISFIADAFIYWVSMKFRYASESMNIKYPPISMLLYASAAYGGLVLSSRSLSNTWEVIFVCIFGFLALSNKAWIVTIQTGLSVWTIFLRPTYPIFILVLAVKQCMFLFNSHKPYFLVKHAFSACISTLFVGLVLIICDTIYYSHNWLPFEPSTWIVTPIRFILYNSNTIQVREHGTQPSYAYFLLHWPLILTPLFSILAFWPISLQSNSSLQISWLSLIIPTIILSTCPHKETRHIIPSLPFALILIGHRIESALEKRKFRRLILFGLIIWCIHQFILTYFLTFMHQAGLIRFYRSLKPYNPSSDPCTINVFYRTYMPPRFPFGINSNGNLDFNCTNLDFENNACNRVIDLAGSPFTDLVKTLTQIKEYFIRNHHKNCGLIRLIVPAPGMPYEVNLNDFGNITSINTFGPHFSSEYPPKTFFPTLKSNTFNWTYLLNFWANLSSQMCLVVYYVTACYPI